MTVLRRFRKAFSKLSHRRNYCLGTLAEIQKATDWQKHSIRGFLSTAAKKQGLKIESTKTEAGDRAYQVRKWGFRIEVD